jgi:uncharacterized membrane protein
MAERDLDPLAIVPRAARPVVVAYAASFALWSMHPVVLGLASHTLLFALLFDEYAWEQLPVIASYPVNELLHRVGGAAMVGLGLAQFSPRLRRRRPRLHRWLGRIYAALALVAVASGLFMAFVLPFGGRPELWPSLVFGLGLALCTGVAVVLARRRRFEAHREWVIRSFAIATGPWSIRISAIFFHHALGMDERVTIVWAFWAGWLINLAVAESWILRRKRRLAAAKAARKAAAGPSPT